MEVDSMSVFSLVKTIKGMRKYPIETLESFGYPTKTPIELLSSPVQVLYLTDPLLTKSVFVERPKKYGMAPFMIKKLEKVLGGGLSVAVGESWRKRRAFMQGFFIGEHLVRLLPYFAQSMDQAHFGTNLPGEKRTIDVTEEMRRITLRNIFLSIFSRSFDEKMTDFFALVSKETGRRFWHWEKPDWFPQSQKDREYKKLIAHIDHYIYDLLRDRIAEARNGKPTASEDVADYMIEAHLGGDPLWNIQALRDELVTLAFAGFDTTACLLTWSILLLASYPQEASPMLAEVRHLWPSFRIQRDFAHLLSSFPETVAFATEVLRLYPPIWLLTREARMADVLGGVEVRPGAHIFTSPHIIQRHPEYWNDPLSFFPSRHKDIEGKNPAYIPFGAGVRHCVGHQFAMAEVVMALADLANKFDFHFPHGESLPHQEPGVVNWPRGKPQLVVTRRESSAYYRTSRSRQSSLELNSTVQEL